MNRKQPKIELEFKPEFTLGPMLGLTPLATAPGIKASTTPLDLTLSGTVRAPPRLLCRAAAVLCAVGGGAVCVRVHGWRVHGRGPS